MKNTVKLLLSFLIVTTWSTQLYADEVVLADSMLWKISGQDLKQPSYLTGTLHIMCAKDFAIFPKVARAIKATDQLVLEVNFKDPKEMAAIQSLMFSETLLTDTLSSEQQVKLNGVLNKAMGLSIEQVNNYSMNTLFSMLLVSAVECPSKIVLDMELSDLAAAEGKVVDGFETIKEQSEFLSKAYSDDFMLEQFELMDEYIHLFDDMVAAFKAEKLNSLLNMMQDERFYNENVEHWLLAVRNKNWVKKMPGIMQTNSTVFAVGAGHLTGESGVIHLLRQAGYTVEAVLE